jgi:orotidine-5'-phosphate decarboxylase
MKKSAPDYLALALDNRSSLDDLRRLIDETASSIGVFKIGLEQFTRFGTPLFDLVRAAHRKIFLDLKFHDIPNTVGKAVEAAAEREVDYLTIHISGGSAMMRAAASAANLVKTKTTRAPKIIGVTLLTSIDAGSLQSDLAVPLPLDEYVRRCAAGAVAARLDGIVCSAADLASVGPLLPDTFEIITPGIRPAGASSHDQKRIATPAEAMAGGATLLVLGRAVTEAVSPGQAAAAIANELEAQLRGD